jgi:hypothetical protein
MTSVAIRSHLNDVWADKVPELFLSEVHNEDDDYRAGLPRMFAVLLYPQSEAQRISIGSPGNNCWRETGVILMRVYMPAGKGNMEVLIACENVRAAFQEYVGLNGYFRIREISPPSDLSGGESQGKFYGAQVEATYTFEYFQ